MSSKSAITPNSPGQFLAWCRQKAGLTQDQLASMASCHRQTVHNVESDKSKPSARQWAVFMDILEVDPAKGSEVWLKQC
jgi:DNA-binding XRE family transcriptional regulator